MQKWEYMLVFSRWDKVMSVNGKEVGGVYLFGGWKGDSLHEFLNRAGAEGWEVAGLSMSVVMQNATSKEPNATQVVLKRPLEQPGDSSNPD